MIEEKNGAGGEKTGGAASNRGRSPVVGRQVKSIRVWLFAGFLISLGSPEVWGKTIIPLQVIRAPQLEQQVSAVPPAERKRIEDAIRVGNRFVNARFSFADFPDHPDSWEDWERDVGPLMAMGVEAWEKVWEKEGWDIGINYRQFVNGRLLACPSVQLEEVVRSGQATRLRYRATLIGISIEAGDSVTAPQGLSMDISRQRQSYVIDVELNQKDRITAVRTPEKTVAAGYQIESNFYDKRVKSILKLPLGMRIAGTNKVITEESRRQGAKPFQDHINAIMKAAAICADTGKSNSLGGK